MMEGGEIYVALPLPSIIHLIFFTLPFPPRKTLVVYFAIGRNIAEFKHRGNGAGGERKCQLLVGVTWVI